MTAPEEGRIPEITVGMRLTIALRAAGMRAGELADELGVDAATVGRWVRDEHKRPIPQLYLKTIALRLGVPYEWLRTGHEGTPTTRKYRGGKRAIPAQMVAAVA